MRRVLLSVTVLALLSFTVIAAAASGAAPSPPPAPRLPVKEVAPNHSGDQSSFLDTNLLVTWYGNPWSERMGILGRLEDKALAEGLKKQAAAYAAATKKHVIPAYELVSIIGQPQPGRDGRYRRRESYDVIDRMLREARAAGFKLILDVQTGHSSVLSELSYLSRYLQEPDVYLALDPEFSMGDGGVPGQLIGTMHADEVNDAINVLEYVQDRYRLPRKVLMVHQFTMAMLPDKDKIVNSSAIDVVLVADGFGPPALKRHTYSMVLRQRALAFSGFKLFYIQDTDLLQPSQVLALTPSPSVVIYQ
jgi:hypothetical protein